jgi:hypothetical protein
VWAREIAKEFMFLDGMAMVATIVIGIVDMVATVVITIVAIFVLRLCTLGGVPHVFVSS